MRNTNAKVMTVKVSGELFFVQAKTKSAALRYVALYLMADAVVDLATGEQIYQAGVNGSHIIGSDRFNNNVDRNQLPLEGIPQTLHEVA